VSLSLKPGTVSACYRGLPTARLALHTTSIKLRGVHRMPLDTLLRTLPGATRPSGDDDAEVCVYAFQGYFAPGQVTGAPPASQGDFAVVAIGSRDLDLVASYVGERLPPHLSRVVTGSALARPGALRPAAGPWW
jgi:hypothetical protein